MDGERYCAVNTGLHCQFKYSKHQGSSSFSHILCRQQVQAEAPGPGPWPLSALLKAFPQPEIKPSAQWQTSGSTDTRPGSKEGARGGREGWRERKRENEGKVGEKVEKWDSKGGGFEGGSQASWCIRKVGKSCGGGRGKLMREVGKVEKVQKMSDWISQLSLLWPNFWLKFNMSNLNWKTLLVLWFSQTA